MARGGQRAAPRVHVTEEFPRHGRLEAGRPGLGALRAAPARLLFLLEEKSGGRVSPRTRTAHGAPALASKSAWVCGWAAGQRSVCS